MKLRLGIPAGSLRRSTLSLLSLAGLEVKTDDRSYYARTSDDGVECLLIRAQEMPRYVDHGALDAGITGRDWVLESGLDVVVVDELAYAKQGPGRIRWVLAVPEGAPFREPEDLAGRTIATELVGVTTDYFAQRGIDVNVEFSWGATEIKPPHLADAIVEATETGNSLRANRLRVIDTVLESTVQLITNPVTWEDPERCAKLRNLALMLDGALSARGRVGLMLNVRREDLPGVLAVLPALNRPTVASLSDDAWVAVNTVIDEELAWEVIPCLKAARAEGIVEYPLNKVVG